MIKTIITAGVTALVVALIVVGLVGGKQSAPPTPFGAEGDTNLTNLVLSGDLTVGDDMTVTGSSGLITIGSNGSALAELKAALCDLSGTTDTSHTASTTKYYYCSVTGVASGDVVFAQSASTTPTNVLGSWIITDARASSTAGFIDLMIYNATGGNRVPSAAVGGIGSSTNILYLDI